jgi:hypothetical protein
MIHGKLLRVNSLAGVNAIPDFLPIKRRLKYSRANLGLLDGRTALLMAKILAVPIQEIFTRNGMCLQNLVLPEASFPCTHGEIKMAIYTSTYLIIQLTSITS